MLTVYALKKDVENAVSGNRQLVLVEEVILNSFLVVFIAVEIVLLEVIKKTWCYCTDAFNVHLSWAELLLAMLYRVLKVFESENQLQKSVGFKLETCSILRTFWDIMGLIKNDDAILVVQGVVGPHWLIEHVVVGHQN